MLIHYTYRVKIIGKVMNKRIFFILKNAVRNNKK